MTKIVTTQYNAALPQGSIMELVKTLALTAAGVVVGLMVAKKLGVVA